MIGLTSGIIDEEMDDLLCLLDCNWFLLGPETRLLLGSPSLISIPVISEGPLAIWTCQTIPESVEGLFINLPLRFLRSSASRQSSSLLSRMGPVGLVRVYREGLGLYET